MSSFFKNCHEAVEHCVDTKGYALFYSHDKDPDRDMHLHECCEVLYCVSGGHSFFINDRIYDVQPGDVFIINQYETHKITSRAGEPFERYVFMVHPSWLIANSSAKTELSKCFYARGPEISHRVALTAGQQAYLRRAFEKLKDEDQAFGADLLKTAAVIETMVYLNNFFSDYNRSAEYKHISSNGLIESVITSINRRLSDNFTLDELAERNFVSKNHLCRLFKKHTGTTVVKYITIRRITEAKRLLKNGVPVKNACEKVGFNDYSHFLRTFKSIVGVSPGKYVSSSDKT